MKKIRDVFLSPITQDDYLIITCDSCGGVGNKTMDQVKVDPFYVGYFTTAVALAENMAIGGDILSVVDTLSVALEGDGEVILSGVKQAMQKAGLSSEQLMTGSTEENIPVVQTAIGVTVIGRIKKERVNQTKSQKGDALVLIGLPKMGERLVEEEIIHKKGEIIQLLDIKKLKGMPFINEVVPVGSKGIDYEAQCIASYNQRHINYTNNALDLKASAGPATCVLVTVHIEKVNEIVLENNKLPIQVIGHLN
ncbi:alpha-ribazole kinase [Natranaerovirga hydrolytica]|uniref:Alpha-ribazole kinase n=1 Tax=Natranaerovirga hydrolytica TaxID=680378 RepID=A0A4R1N7I2_9FIRM|nr:AIR synthase related protein [Natranaerovirga hydrolytica]TCK98623.1 alpha-ribazole kinase [Natranaerovirga hydrolytica]